MARHRTLMTRVRRGIARWPIVVVALAVLAGLGWTGWMWVDSVLDHRAAALLTSCPAGESTLRIAVTPSAADPIRAAAENWTKQHPIVNDHCVRVQVQSVDSETVLTGLTQNWDEGRLGPRPDAWLPDSTLWVNRLSAQNNNLIGAAGISVATSPVVLATQSAAYDALTAGNLLRWTDLPALSAEPAGWSRYGRPQWGKFRLAVPDPATSPASAMAIQSALAGATAQGTGPVTTAMLAEQPVKNLITQLVSSRAGGAPATPQDAMDGLSKAADVGTASYGAVPVTEVDLYRRNVGKDGAPAPANPLYEVPMGGASPRADFPFVTLAGDWINSIQGTAAQQFRDFLRRPEQQRLLVTAGLRGEGGGEHPKPAPGMRWPAPTEQLVPADATTTQQISASWTAAVEGDLVVSALVDVSAPMGQDGGDGRSQLDWVKDALNGQIDRTVSGSLGLWTFARAVDGDRNYRQVAPVASVGDHVEQLHAAVGQLAPAGAPQLDDSLLAVYRSVLDGYQAGKHNRIVVVVGGAEAGGPNADQLRGQLDRLRDPARPVPISIIAVGTGPDRDQLGAIARASGGTLSVLRSAKGIDATLGQLLSVAG
ncbi:MAG: VWA domain-containing protein [Kutzneria sp.]|nr:VWA domain-containing protein [Kutzneria sp.]MBV9845569.1 VWA domain-containing protein [Kutzneria sp.]